MANRPINDITITQEGKIVMTQGAAVECLGQLKVVVNDALMQILHPDDPQPWSEVQ